MADERNSDEPDVETQRGEVTRAHDVHNRVAVAKAGMEAALQRQKDALDRAADRWKRAQAALERRSAAERRIEQAREGRLTESTPDERERAADRREADADARDRAADRREKDADERERVADRREKDADERERVADRRDTSFGSLIGMTSQTRLELAEQAMRLAATAEQVAVQLEWAASFRGDKTRRLRLAAIERRAADVLRHNAAVMRGEERGMLLSLPRLMPEAAGAAP